MIIGLTGPQRAGKTTVLEYLVKRHRFHPMSIAALIKQEAHQYAGHAYDDVVKDRPAPELGGKTPRDLYIQVGNLDEFIHDLWVKRMFRQQYQGPDEWHVIESIGKQFQYSEIVRMCEKARDGVVILDVSRPDHAYKDSRSPIRDSYPVLTLVNDGEIGKLHKELDDFVHNDRGKVTHVRNRGDVAFIEAIEKEVYGQ